MLFRMERIPYLIPLDPWYIPSFESFKSRTVDRIEACVRKLEPAHMQNFAR